MRQFLLALLILSSAWALELTKQVSGPELIDVNESLRVTVTISSETPVLVQKLEDDVPAHFAAVGYPSACTEEENRLVCSFGQEVQGVLTVKYALRALGTGYGIIGSPRLYYDGGVKTVGFFRQYFIGKPRVQLELEGAEALLPGENITLTVKVSNPGTREVSGARLTVNHTYGQVEEEFSLNPGEEIIRRYLLGQAGKRGGARATVEVRWGNSSLQKGWEVVFIAPEVQVRREIGVRWKVSGGELVPLVRVTYIMKNNGTAAGNVSFLSGGSYSLVPGESRRIVMEYGGKAPAEKVTVRDSRGVVYGTFSFEERVPEMKKDFFTLLYEYVAYSFSPLMLALVAAGALYFASKFHNPNVKAGFLLLALVAGLLIYSQYRVGAFSLPSLAGRPSIGSILNASLPR